MPRDFSSPSSNESPQHDGVRQEQEALSSSDRPSTVRTLRTTPSPRFERPPHATLPRNFFPGWIVFLKGGELTWLGHTVLYSSVRSVVSSGTLVEAKIYESSWAFDLDLVYLHRNLRIVYKFKPWAIVARVSWASTRERQRVGGLQWTTSLNAGDGCMATSQLTRSARRGVCALARVASSYSIPRPVAVHGCREVSCRDRACVASCCCLCQIQEPDGAGALAHGRS